MTTRWPRALARGTLLGAAATAGMILWLAADHWTEPRKWSIVGAPFLASLFLATATLVAGSWLLHRWFTRWGLRLGATVLALTFVAAIINAHFGYLPTVDTLLGRRAADQVSAADFNRMETDAARPIRSVDPPRPMPAKGSVIKFEMPGTASGFHARLGQVYLPPAWFQYPRPHLPVIELLHGSPGSTADWTRAGLADVTADAYAKAHGGVAPIIVMPDVNGKFWGDTECVDGLRGNAETYLTRDVRDAVVARFGTRADGGGWIIAGLSEGGYCASMLALRHPDLYAAAGNFSGDDRLTDDGNPRKLFGGTWAEAHDQEHAHDSRALLEAWPTGKAGPALWFSAGRSDDVLPRLRHLHELAQRTGLATTLETPGGDHNFRVWRTSFADALPWLMSHISSDPTIPNAHFTGVVTSR